MAVNDTTVSQTYPRFQSLTYPNVTVSAPAITTGTTTMTTAQLLGGLLTVNCTDAGTFTTPTAALINAAIPGVAVGCSFQVDIVNYGDDALTIGLGTGVTKVTIAGVSAVLTLATLVSKRFRFVCTGVATEAVVDSADAWVVYAFGSTAAAVSA